VLLVTLFSITSHFPFLRCYFVLEGGGGVLGLLPLFKCDSEIPHVYPTVTDVFCTLFPKVLSFVIRLK